MKIRFVCLIAVILSIDPRLPAAEDERVNLASSILSEALARRILGAEVEPGSANTQPDGNVGKMRVSRCSYTAKTAQTDPAQIESRFRSSEKTKAPGMNAVHLDLLLRQSENPEDVKAQFESAKVLYRGQDVAGLGHAAFRATMPPQLHVLKGRSYIVVTARTFKADPALEESVASEILRRLRD